MTTKKESIEALSQIASSFITLNEFIHSEETHSDFMNEVKGYPFNSSFDELVGPVCEWTRQCIKYLNTEIQAGPEIHICTMHTEKFTWRGAGFSEEEALMALKNVWNKDPYVSCSAGEAVSKYGVEYLDLRPGEGCKR